FDHVHPGFGEGVLAVSWRPLRGEHEGRDDGVGHERVVRGEVTTPRDDRDGRQLTQAQPAPALEPQLVGLHPPIAFGPGRARPHPNARLSAGWDRPAERSDTDTAPSAEETKFTCTHGRARSGG